MTVEHLAIAPPPQRICPICKITFYPAVLAGLELWHCVECNGTAWPRPTLGKLRTEDINKEMVISEQEKHHKTPTYFTPRQKPPFLICPLCGKRMKETKLAAVPVDLCEKCTCLWLDGPKRSKLVTLLGPYKWRLTNG